MKLRFEELGKILDIEPGKEQEHVMVFSSEEEGRKLYQIKDHPKEQKVGFRIK